MDKQYLKAQDNNKPMEVAQINGGWYVMRNRYPYRVKRRNKRQAKKAIKTGDLRRYGSGIPKIEAAFTDIYNRTI